MSKFKQTGKNTFLIKTPNGPKVTIECEALFPFKEECAIFRVSDPITKKKQFGFIDVYGQKLTDKLYDKAESFELGFAKVYKDSMQNYIISTGDEVLSWNYSYVEKFVGNTFIINYYSEDGLSLWGLVNVYEDFIIPPTCNSKLEVLNKAKNLLPEIIKKWT